MSASLFPEAESYAELPAEAPVEARIDPHAQIVLTGEVVYVIYSNNESGFRVLRVRLEDSCGGDGKRNEVVAGRSSTIRLGDRVRAVGRWKSGRHGLQLEAETITALDAVTVEGLARSIDGLVFGLGPARSRRLVHVLGGAEEAIRVLDQVSSIPTDAEIERTLSDPDTLLGSLSWLPQQVRIDLVLAWRTSRVEREVEARLASLDLSSGLRSRLVARYGTDAARVVLEEPYRLPAEVDGVGFLTADDVALKVGVGIDSFDRIDAATLHVMREESEDGGHTVCSASDLARAMFTLFMQRRPPAPIVEEGAACVERSIARLLDGGRVRLARDGASVCLPYLSEAEETIAKRLRSLLSAERAPLEFAGAVDPDLTEEQQLAVRSVFERGVCVLTGGPGVGKTHTCKEIVRVAQSLGLRVALCAPTARAAKRLSEMTQDSDAVTIHRLLEARGTGRFERHEGNPISADLIVADESSMIDCSLMAALLSAVDPLSRLVLVGDKDQLPPVGPGAPFRDLIVSGVVPVAKLTKIHRQAAGSAIVRVAHAVLHGSAPCPSPEGDRTDGCVHLVRQSNPEAAAKTVVQVVLGLQEELGIDPWETLVLAPMRKGSCGVTALNNALQRAMNPPSADLPEIEYGKEDGKRTYRRGDRVRQTKNDYERGVVNGDVGRIVEIYPEKTRPRGGPWLDVNFNGVGVVHYDGAQLNNLVLAYCTTIHSAQGGQSPAVVLALVDQHYVMLTRTLLYTAITRAEHACLIVGSRRATETAARNAKDDARRTSLPRMLKDLVVDANTKEAKE